VDYDAPGTKQATMVAANEDAGYHRLILAASRDRIARVHGPEAEPYRQLYQAATNAGCRLRDWRGGQHLSRAAAATKLAGWSRTTITLLEQGLLLISDLSPQMTASLKDVGIAVGLG